MENRIDDIEVEGFGETYDDATLQEQMPSDYELLEVRRAINRSRLAMPDVDKEWSKWMDNIKHAEMMDENTETDINGKKASFIRLARVVIAAAAVAALFFVIRGINSPATLSPNEVFTANPNSKDVMLSTDNGEMQVVSDKSLAFTPIPGNQKNKGKHIKMVTLSTPRGKTIKATLPDGTQVYMNADSKIVFPERFTGEKRNITVSGEVFMEVTPDKQHPFVVNTDYFTTTVLGTVFNIRAHSQRDASLTLVSGSVDISDKENKEHHILHPNEQIIWDKETGFDISTVDTYPIIQWKDGFFYFNNMPLLNIMQELGRWYNVSVVFENPSDMQRQLHIVAERDEPIEKILKRLNDLDIVTITFSNGIITIS
ncbi:MAG: FecR domain-containing protein [Prevotella sp.]|nr:FecR domain-containing protein [Prevotella sp.]